MKEKQQWLNVPNVLSTIRLLMVGVLVYFFSRDDMTAAVITFIVAELTDVLDGYLARRNKMVTDFGKLMDPLADKLMLIVALLCLYLAGRLPLLILLVVCIKEALMILGGIFIFRKRAFVVTSNIFGKVAAFVFSCAVVLAFLHDYVKPVDEIALYVALGLSMAAMVVYAVRNLFGHPEREGQAVGEEAKDEMSGGQVS